jgi:hypothetical protein
LLKKGFVLFKAPVGSPTFCVQVVNNRVGKCALLMDKLHTLENPQIQFGLLRSCFGFPKFAYCLRSCDPNTMKNAYEAFNEAQCRAVSDCIGAQICVDDDKWLQTSLKVSMGGLGIQSVVVHSAAAFIASSLQTQDLVQKLLGNGVSPRDTTTALSLFTNATTPLEFPLTATTATQRVLSRRVDESRLIRLIEVTTDMRQKALISSVPLKHTGDFLNVVPSPQLGLKLQGTEFHLASQVRLGRPVYPHGGRCPFCEKPSDDLGEHAISACGFLGDRTRRHDTLRDALFAITQAAMLAPKKEEKNLLDDSSRPGDITIPSWH